VKNKTLIINPPFFEPHRPSISCAILAEIYRLEGHDVTVLDLNIELFHVIKSERFHEFQINFVNNLASGEELEEFAQWLDQQLINLDEYEWITITGFSFWNNKMVRIICENIRSKTKTKIVVGGPGIEANNYGQRLHSESLVDYYVHGEAEIALRELINGNVDYPGINGRPPLQIEDIEDLPLPNYSYFDFSKYDLLLEKPDLFIYGSRGCVRKCTFCDVEHYWPKFRYRSGKSIAEEMISNYERFGVTNYFFTDSLVNGNMKEFHQFAETIAKYQPGLFTWGGYAIVRPKRHHPAELFDIIRDSGGKFWSIGIETGVDRVREEMKKKFSNEDVDWHLEQSQRIRLQNMFLMISSWPTETPEEHLEYLKIFKRWKKYALDRTIYGVAISPALAVLESTPLSRTEGSDFTFDHYENSENVLGANFEDAKPFLWLGKEGTGLSHKEKIRRSIAIYREATLNHWPIINYTQKLIEIESTIDLTLTHIKQPSRTIIPIESK